MLTWQRCGKALLTNEERGTTTIGECTIKDDDLYVYIIRVFDKSSFKKTLKKTEKYCCSNMILILQKKNKKMKEGLVQDPPPMPIDYIYSNISKHLLMFLTVDHGWRELRVLM